MIWREEEYLATPVPGAWVQEAERVAGVAKENYGSKTHAVKDDRDVIGSIGEFTVRKWGDEKYLTGFSLPPYKPGAFGDTEDGFADGVQFDVKTSGAPFSPWLTGTVRVFAHHIDKPMDAYFFVWWDRNANVSYMLGWCPSGYFRRRAFYLPKGTPFFGKDKKPARDNSYELEIRRLYPMKDFCRENFHHLNREDAINSLPA